MQKATVNLNDRRFADIKCVMPTYSKRLIKMEANGDSYGVTTLLARMLISQLTNVHGWRDNYVIQTLSRLIAHIERHAK